MISRDFEARISGNAEILFRVLEPEVVIHPQDAFFVQNPLSYHHSPAAKTFPGVRCVLNFNIVDRRFILDYVCARNLVNTERFDNQVL